MILPHKNRVSIMDIQMIRKRRLSETTVMSEFDSIKPYFTNACDELISACPQDSSSPSEDIWKKFELLPTPPRSPQHSRDDDLELKPDFSACIADFDALASYLISPDGYNFTEESTTNADKNPSSCEPLNAQQQLIKDCMWNGVGHKSSERFRNSKNRRSSPDLSRSPCHANGCVDPRNIFPYPVGRPSCCDRNSSRRFPSPPRPSLHSRSSAVVDGTETPSDSEEEIDVVTVESKQHNLNVLKSRPNGRTPTAATQKISAHLVPKENGSLTLVRQKSGASNYVTKAFNDMQDSENRGRPRNKQIHVLSAAKGQASAVAQTVAMVFERRGDAVKSVNDGKQVKLQKVQVKNLPHGNDVIKRRHTTEEQSHLWRLANPKSVMRRSDSVSPDPTKAGKISLDGISFSATTGARQYTTEYNRQKENSKWAVTVSSLKTAQEAALNVSSVRSKPRSRIQTNANRRKIDENDATGIVSSPPMKRKRKAETLNSGSSGSGSDSEQIRAAHNVLERQRREGLRASFHELRDHVPELRNMEKTPKVNILNKARDYCLELAETERRMMEEKKSLLKRQELLQRRLQRLTEVESESSGVESDIDESKNELLSPEPSLPSSPQVFPAQTQSGFIIARRVSNEDRKNASQPEVLLCLEPCTNNASRQTSHRKRFVLTPSEYSGTKAKQIKYIANLQQKKSDRSLSSLLSFQNNGALSDGFDEYYESEEEGRCLNSLQTVY